jgi:hypothetical protein
LLYCFNRFKKGFRPRRFGKQIEEFGKAIGDRLEDVIERMNESLTDYEHDAKESGSHIKKIHVRRKKMAKKDCRPADEPPRKIEPDL